MRLHSIIKDLLILITIILLFIINPIFAILSDKFVIPLALSVVIVVYAIKKRVNSNEYIWKNVNLGYFFRLLDNPCKSDLYVGMFTLILGGYAAQLLGFSNSEIFTAIFFSYYLVKCVVISMKYETT